MYEFTHLSWRKRDDDGHVSNLVHVIPDKERAAAEIAELMVNPNVLAVRAIHYPQPSDEAEATEFHTKIGPPVTD